MKTWLMTALSPIAGGMDSAISWVKGGVGGYADMRSAVDQNVELRAEVERLTAERDAALERARQAEVYGTEIGPPPKSSYKQILANVISRDSSVWFRRLVIDRGTTDGIKQNMPVATSTGVVGRVISVGPNWASVQVITDKHAGVGAMLQDSRAMGELRGRDPEDARCELKNIPGSTEVKVGEPVVTTGLDRIYPKGLMIGTVETIESDPNAPWHRIVVRPAAPVDRAEQLLVLLVEQKDLKIEDLPNTSR